MSDHWKTSHTIGCFAIIIAIVLVGLLLPPGSPDARLWAWIATLVLLLAFTYTVSNGITGLWRGALIDERKRNKTATEPDEKEKERTLNQLEKQGTDRNEVVTQGVLVTNTTPAGAQWADLFKGEETGNAALLDVAKLQMFYFTLIVVIAYAVNLGTMMKSAKPVTSFPDLSEGLIALLGISHAGYLSSKAVTHSTTT